MTSPSIFLSELLRKTIIVSAQLNHTEWPADRYPSHQAMLDPSNVHGLRPVQTADPSDTIWSIVSEDDFRQHLVALEKRTNAVPIDVMTERVKGTCKTATSSEILPLVVEKQVADDLAYIAAVSEGAQSVAAVCLEQHISLAHGDECERFLNAKIAGMDIVDDAVKNMLGDIAEVLQVVARSTSTDEDREHSTSVQVIFNIIIQQHTQKILGRLRSKKWTKPTYLDRTHKKSLWQDFANVIHRVQHIYPKKSERRVRESTVAQLTELAKIYEGFETTDTESSNALQQLVQATYRSCRLPEMSAYALKLEQSSSTPQIGAALKTLRQLEKIGAYWRIAEDLVTAASQYSAVFHRIHFEYVPPYASVPTDITYESWAGKCHVHAEVQLVVEIALQAQNRLPTISGEGTRMISPRTIGTSKYLCYLCHLFLHYHGGFTILSTHGRLYDQWTVPDLAEYGFASRRKLASVLRDMDAHVRRRIEELQGVVWRAEPMTSRQNLLGWEEAEEEEGKNDEVDHNNKSLEEGFGKLEVVE